MQVFSQDQQHLEPEGTIWSYLRWNLNIWQGFVAKSSSATMAFLFLSHLNQRQSCRRCLWTAAKFLLSCPNNDRRRQKLCQRGPHAFIADLKLCPQWKHCLRKWQLLLYSHKPLESLCSLAVLVDLWRLLHWTLLCLQARLVSLAWRTVCKTFGIDQFFHRLE